jgi:hypothetical protein
MTSNIYKRQLLLLAFFLLGLVTIAQTVPMGVSYQAVARDNYGKELANAEIDVRFSIISGNPQGTIVYQELHSNVITSKYGVFSLVIGKGESTGGSTGELSGVKWETANHYLKVEIKFDNNYLDMGTMQFLAVPYALYAQKSLEPGPQGPKGDRGDPATDNQVLSFDGTNLTISGGNTLNLSTLNVPHQLSVSGTDLSIMGGNTVPLPNQIQDLTIDSNNKLKITKNTTATEIDLSPLNQTLSFSTDDNKLSISGGTSTVDLTALKNDADANPTNEIQDISLTGNNLTISNNPASVGVGLSKYDNSTLTYNPVNYNLSISNGNSVNLGSIIAFRARKTVAETGLGSIDYDFIAPIIDYNDGTGYDGVTGIFTVPVAGIYTFVVGFSASSLDNTKSLKLFVNGVNYETLNSDIPSRSIITRSLSMKLFVGDKVKVVVNPGLSTESGIGSFSGYRVY